MFTALGAGAGHTGLARARKRERERLREVLFEPWPGPDRYASLLDLFWDLGASDFALEILGNQQLLPLSAPELSEVFARLDARAAIYGSYEAMVADLLDAIQEFYREHRAAGARRALPTLRIETQRLLPAAPEDVNSASSPPQQSPELATSFLLELDLDARASARDTRATALVPIASDIDLDGLTQTSPGRLLDSLLNGHLRGELRRLFEARHLRALRRELDQHLAALYRHLIRLAERDPHYAEPLYDLARRWEREARRLEGLERQRPWSHRPWAPTADLLMEEARIKAHYLANHARENTDEALRAMQRHAKRGDLAMAGYLVYVNRHAFFAGRGDAHVAALREIEFATARIREELWKLRTRGAFG